MTQIKHPERIKSGDWVKFHFNGSDEPVLGEVVKVQGRGKHTIVEVRVSPVRTEKMYIDYITEVRR